MSKKRHVEIVFSQTFLQSVISLFCRLSCSKPKCNNNTKKGKGPHQFHEPSFQSGKHILHIKEHTKVEE